jgi:hypothetical protein
MAIAFSHIKDLVKNSMYCTLATTIDGHPHCSPIGSIYLNDEKSGYYLEMMTTSAAKTLPNCGKACLLAVNTSSLFWVRSLLKGRFDTPPAVRLQIRLGDLRPSTEIEVKRFQKRVRFFRGWKGYRILWSRPGRTREFTIEKVVPVSLGEMTRI